MDENVARLQEYLSKVMIMPRKGKAKKGDTPKAELEVLTNHFIFFSSSTEDSCLISISVKNYSLLELDLLAFAGHEADVQRGSQIGFIFRCPTPV